MRVKLPVTPEILAAISRLDHFQGSWYALGRIPSERLARLEEAARARSVGASCRLAGLRVTDSAVASVLRGDTAALPDSTDVLGYDVALRQGLPGRPELLNGAHLRRLHATMLGAPDDGPPTEWRSQPLVREAFDAEGKASGRIFSTLPPRLVEEKTEELLTWLELELRERGQHPVLVVGAFVLYAMAISPFERGNGRLARLLLGLLLRRAGYGFIPYGSLESQIERLRGEYNDAVDRGQMRIWTEEADLTPWLDFVLEVLDRQREGVEAKMELERQAQEYPPLQQAILETVREHGNVDAALLIRATGANRNTLKDNLRRLVATGVLEKTGRRRGTRYRLAAGEPAGAAPQRVLQH